MKRRYKTLAGLLAKPERWTTHVRARNKNGNECSPHSDKAICFCPIGGAMRVYGMRMERVDALLLKALNETDPGSGAWTFWIWNDTRHRKHADILRVARRFDKLVKARSAK